MNLSFITIGPEVTRVQQSATRTHKDMLHFVTSDEHNQSHKCDTEA